MDVNLNNVELKQYDFLPEGILDATPQSLINYLPQPALIHLTGKQAAPLFVSVMLHGNEPTGLLAVQALLKKYENRSLPRSMSIFFGNAQAAAAGLRRLNGQPDYNRIWPGTELPDSPETRMAQDIVDVMRARKVFASIDIHNNTGLNPHYACINKLDHRFLQLASLFGRLVVYFTRPKGVQSAAFAELCPSVTLECGKPGQLHGVEHAFEFLNSCLNLSGLPEHPVHEQDIDVYHTVAQVKVADSVKFSFQEPESDLLLDKDIERMNFNEISAGTVLGKVSDSVSMPLIALDDRGHDISTRFFEIQGGELSLIRKTMPSMLTLDERVIRQDCLCYLMERLQHFS
ncbi:M14 family metallopeptidase [Methylicorpusculum sp.]|uniref:M14 family metallopeptidase n=1 Tax=Methylicorpusculum sp. TaxID=2713644 RepID=UPI0027260444|nr:M14 family metallopeptidase [Methylicorpusculum sp.]MDO8844146.1 M14 family metallopeptidase [Methylicorpusculum sp.]